MPIEVSPHCQVKLVKDQVSCDLGEEAVVLECVKGIYYGLNPVAATIWRELKQAPTTAQLRDTILREYDVDAERCTADLLAVLQELHAAGLIEVQQIK